MNRDILFALTEAELRELAEKHKILSGDEFDRTLLVDELASVLDPTVEENRSIQMAAVRFDRGLDPTYTSTVGELHFNFPDRYGESRIYLVTRDPYWIFVDWEIDAHETALIQTNETFQGFFIRIYALRIAGDRQEVVDAIDVMVDGDIGRQCMQLVWPELCHKAVFFADMGGHEKALASSSIMREVRLRPDLDSCSPREIALYDYCEAPLDEKYLNMRSLYEKPREE